MSEKAPLVTIVTPTFEKFDKIYCTIDSVLKQNYCNIEFILSDDASKAFPEAEIFDYINGRKNDNIKNFLILQNENNLGTVRHLNKIYKQASGDIIVNLAGDDMFYNDNVISDIVKFFQLNNSLVIVTSRLVCDEDLNPMFFWPHMKERKVIDRFNTPNKQYKAFVTEKFYDMASGSAIAFKKEIFEEIGYYDENYSLWEDVPFLTRFTLNNRIDFAYDIISIYYRMGGVSNKNSLGNTLMHSDRIYYNHVDRVKHLDTVSRFTRANIKFINARYECTSKFKIFGLYMKHPIVMLSKLIYKARRKSSLKYDLKVLKKMNKANAF